MGLMDRANNALRAMRGDPVLSMDEWIGYFNYGNNIYTYAQGLNQTLTGKVEEIDSSYIGYVRQAYKSNGIVFACMLARMMLFSEARLRFREIGSDGTPGQLFGGTDGRNPANRELALLGNPWPGATMGDLMSRAIQDVDVGGNFYAARRPGRIKRMRPDWVSIVLGSEDPRVDLDGRDLDAEVLGYIFHPGGRSSGLKAVPLMASEVAHFAPIPDPEASFIGMSWITPIVREVMGDSAVRDHKLRFFENGATPNMVVALDKDAGASKSTQAFKEWVEAFKDKEPSGRDAYKTLYLAGGTSVDVVGQPMVEDFKVIQGAGETRIAATSGIHPTLVGLSEGMQGSSLNAGNFDSAKRLTAAKTLRPLWRNFAGSMSTIINVPTGSELWYDDNIPFLAEDILDRAKVAQILATTIGQLVRDGFPADAAIEAAESEDMTKLKGTHTGLLSVQLQPPLDPDAEPEPPTNGNGKGKDLADTEKVAPRSEPPVINISSPVTIEAGAVQATFEPAQTHIHERAFVVEPTQVTVERTDVHIDEGAVRVDAPVTVEPARMVVEEGAFPITVERSDVTIAEGAVKVDSPVTVERTEVRVEPAEVNIPPAPRMRKVVERNDKGQITETRDEVID